MTSSPLCAWETYTWTALDMTTVGCTGSSSSETSACSGWLWIGTRIPSMSVSTDVWPAAQRATVPAPMGPRVVCTPGDPVAVGGEPGDLAVLDEVDPGLVRAAGEAPGDVVVLGDAGAGLVGGPEHRVADVGRGVDDRADLADLVRLQPLRIDAVELVGL